MPTDQPGHLIAEEAPPQESPIENELPTYRAISNRAVFSVICGVLASFSFFVLNFLVFAVLAVILGALAHRAIKRTPDTITGAGLANAGIAMGLVFGLIVVTYTGIQTFTLRRAATRFALEYAEALKYPSLGQALLYREMPEQRKTQTPEAKFKEFQSMGTRDQMMAQQRLGPLISLHTALQSKDARINFVRIEDQGPDEQSTSGVFYYALALYEVEGVQPPAGTPAGSHQDTYALAIFKARHKGRHYEWWVDDVRYPYALKSYQKEAKPVDDGHGHAPGAH